ncbi:unnamed protein product [Closterium sp. NIES-53]
MSSWSHPSSSSIPSLSDIVSDAALSDTCALLSPSWTGAAGAGGATGAGAPAGSPDAVPPGSGGTPRPRLYFVPLLEQVLGLPPSPGPAPFFACPQPVPSQSLLQPVSPLPAPSPYTGPTVCLAERRAPTSCPASCPASPARPACTIRRTSRPRPPAVPSTHQMALRPSTASLRVPLPSPPASSLPAFHDPESDSLRAASPTVALFLATVVTDPSLASTAASALVAELVDFALSCRLDYAASLVAESASVCPPSVGGECALSTDVLEDRQEEFQCFAAALPHLVSTLLAREGDPDAPDIPTPRSYAEAIEGPYSSQWQAAMDAEMASWKSTGTYVDEVPPPGANIVSGMWIFRVKRPPGSPPVFKARYVARGFSQRKGVDYFQTFSPTPKMTTLRVLLHVAAHRDYELHSLDFSTAFLQGSLHEEIWLRRPPSFTGSFPPGTQWSLRRPVYGLRQAPHEWHDTLRTTLAALGFAPSTADLSLFLRTDTSLPPFYVLVYVDDLVFATADTAGLAHVKSELQKRHTCTDMGELRSYLGLQITRDRAQRTITLTQSHMVQQLRQSFGSDFPVLRLHSDRGGEFSSGLLGAYCRARGIRQTFTLPDSPQQNGIAERRIGMVMDVARTSMMHAAAPHFLWPFAVRNAAHQINLHPRVSRPETSPALLWTGKVGDASAFRVWGSRAFVRDLSADKLSPHATPCVFLGFPPDAPRWQFYHPTSRRVLSSQDVTFDESVPYYRLFPYRTPSLPPPPLFLVPGPPPVDPLPPRGPAPSGVSQVDAVEPVGATGDSGAAAGAEPGGAGTGGAEPGGAEPGGPETGGAEPGGAEPGGAATEGAPPGGALSRREPLSPPELREWFARRWRRAAGAGGSSAAEGTAATGPGGASTGGPGAAGPEGSSGAGTDEGVGAETTTGSPASVAPGAAGGSGATGGAAGGSGAAGGAAGGTAGAGSPAGGPGPVPAVPGVATRPRPYFVPLLQQVLGLPLSPGPPPPPLERPQPVQSQLQPASPLPAPSPYAGPTGGLTKRREPASRPASPVRTARTSGRGSRQLPPPVPGTHRMSLRPSTAPLRAPLPSPPASSLPPLADPESDSLRAASPTVTRLLATAVTDPSFESSAASALVIELVDFAEHCRLDYAASLVAESESACSPSVGGECALGTDVLEDRQEEFQCLAAASPHLASVLLAPEGDPDALDIPTPRSYAEAIEVGFFAAALDTPGDLQREVRDREPSGPYPELVGCLMYLMTCTRPDLAYPLSILTRYVAPGRHRPEHMAAAKRVLRYLCSTSGMGLVLGGRHPVVLTGHADASWADDQATQRSSQGYTFSLGSGSVSWRSTHSSSVLSSSCEAEIYAGAMAAQELRWLTYLLTDL